MADETTIALAKAAWAKTGRPISAVDRMDDEEIELLASIDQGEGFRERIDDFVGGYYERRKAVDDSELRGGFGSVTN